MAQKTIQLSEFMKLLNSDIAKQANKEDNCTGHFWEGRFKSQALLDEKALAAAMAYVDLNPVRAGTAKTPETSPHTSVRRRINALKAKQQQPSGYIHLLAIQVIASPTGSHLNCLIIWNWSIGLAGNGEKKNPSYQQM